MDPDTIPNELACIDIHGLLKDPVMAESAEVLFKYMLSKGMDKSAVLAAIGNSLIEIHNNPYGYAQPAALPLAAGAVATAVEACAANPACVNLVALTLTGAFAAGKIMVEGFDVAEEIDTTMWTPEQKHQSQDEEFLADSTINNIPGFDWEQYFNTDEGFTIPEGIDTSILLKGEFNLDKTKALIKLLPDEVQDGRIDYTRKFSDDLDNFIPNTVKLHHGKLKEDLVLVNYHDSDKKLGSGKDDRTLSWATHISGANKIATIDEVYQRLALVKPEWGKRDEVTLVRIPAGTDVTFVSGRAKEQISVETGEKFRGGEFQIRLRDFDHKWIKESKIFKGK